MMISFGLFGLLILATAMLWTLHLIFSNIASSDSQLESGLTISSWVVIHLAAFGIGWTCLFPYTLVPWVIFVVATFTTIYRYRRQEQHALLWSLAISSERGAPLESAADAFAEERGDGFGAKTKKFARLLRQGHRLPEAMQQAGHRLNLDGRLALNIGAETGYLSQAIRGILGDQNRQNKGHTPFFERLGYLMTVCIFAFFVLVFLFIKIIPIINMIFRDTALDLPLTTVLVVAYSEKIVYMLPCCFPVLPFVVLFPLLSYVGMGFYNVPMMSKMRARKDGALILKSLSILLKQQMPISRALEVLTSAHPHSAVKRRLQQARAEADGGGSWTTGLRKVGLIGAADVAVLDAASRVDNLPWALEEMAIRNLRIIQQRKLVVLHVVEPLLLFFIAICIGLVSVAILQPLFSLTMGLSGSV